MNTNQIYDKMLADPIFTPALQEQIYEVQEYQTLTEQFVDKVLAGVHKNAVIQGSPGLGKSYAVQQALLRRNLVEKKDFLIVKGHITPLQLFATLYHFRRPGQVVVLDDCDDIFGNEVGIGMIKSATDPDNRRVSYSSSRTPRIAGVVVEHFVYHGTLIICSNVMLSIGTGRRDQHIRAIMSRTTNWPMGWDTNERKFAQIFNMVVNADYLSRDARTKITDTQKADMLMFILDNLDEITSLDLRLPQKIAAEIVSDSGNWRRASRPFLRG
jgi:hypothetical protein